MSQVAIRVENTESAHDYTAIERMQAQLRANDHARICRAVERCYDRLHAMLDVRATGGKFNAVEFQRVENDLFALLELKYTHRE